MTWPWLRRCDGPDRNHLIAGGHSPDNHPISEDGHSVPTSSTKVPPARAQAFPLGGSPTQHVALITKEVNARQTKVMTLSSPSSPSGTISPILTGFTSPPAPPKASLLLKALPQANLHGRIPVAGPPTMLGTLCPHEQATPLFTQCGMTAHEKGPQSHQYLHYGSTPLGPALSYPGPDGQDTG